MRSWKGFWAQMTLRTWKEAPMIFYVIGLGLITKGFWEAWHPLGWIVAGAALAWMAVEYEKSSVVQPPEEEKRTSK